MTATTVVLAGGRGTRIAPVAPAGVPKALLEVAGRPLIDRKLEELAANGVTEVVVLSGHGHEALASHLAAHPRPSVAVRVVPDGDDLLGTGGAIAAVLPQLPSPFWVTYGDTLLEVEMAPIEGRLGAEADGLVVVVRNVDEGQPSNTSVEGDHVVAYGKGAPPGTHDHLDYGLLLLRREAFDGFTAGSSFDLEAVLQALVARRRLVAHVVEAEYHDIGTPEAWEATGRHYGDG